MNFIKDCAYLKFYKKYILFFIIDFSQHLKIYIIYLYYYYYYKKTFAISKT